MKLKALALPFSCLRVKWELKVLLMRYAGCSRAGFRVGRMCAVPGFSLGDVQYPEAPAVGFCAGAPDDPLAVAGLEALAAGLDAQPSATTNQGMLIDQTATWLLDDLKTPKTKMWKVLAITTDPEQWQLTAFIALVKTAVFLFIA